MLLKMKKILLIVVLCFLTGAINANQLYQGSKSGPISMDFKNISVRELLQFIAESMNLNVIMSASVSGSVSLHFRNILWQNALDLVLEMTGLVKSQRGNTIFIATANEFALRQKQLNEALPLKFVKFKLLHIDVNQAQLLVQNQVNLLSSLAKITVNPLENSLWIKENTENLPHIMRYLKQIDVLEKQLLIHAKIVNVDDQKVRELGIQFGLNTVGKSIDALSQNLPVTETHGLCVAFTTLVQQQLINVQLDALEKAGFSQVIACPQLIAQNHKTADIEAGEEVPYQEKTASGATNVSFKKAALSVKVTPTILPDGNVFLALEITQNKISPLSVQGVPVIQTQELKTEVLIHRDETVILGGIYEFSESIVSRQLPFLGELPVVGNLFSCKSKQQTRKQLLIFVSPHLLAESTDQRIESNV